MQKQSLASNANHKIGEPQKAVMLHRTRRCRRRQFALGSLLLLCHEMYLRNAVCIHTQQHAFIISLHASPSKRLLLPKGYSFPRITRVFLAGRQAHSIHV